MKMIDAEQVRAVFDMMILGVPGIITNPDEICNEFTAGDLIDYTQKILGVMKEAVMDLQQYDVTVSDGDK